MRMSDSRVARVWRKPLAVMWNPTYFRNRTRLEPRPAKSAATFSAWGPDCPWALRRLKKDLRDLEGRRLFPDRHARTIAFRLNRDEFDLYKAATAYINEFLPQASGKKKQSVALIRTVLQRRLASSTLAIFESIRRRLEKQQAFLTELENLPSTQRARPLAQLQGRIGDAEQDEDDLDETERDQLTDEFTAAVELDQLRSEIAALQELLSRARRVRDQAADSKLSALQQCLARAEFKELTDGRGKLLIFTEHRDTLKHLRQHLEKWGYTVTEIHGGMNPHERKRAQEDFRTSKQICVATEAAGEGINLQFCRLMINYDLPWNPTRLEQRLGRIHRIGQERDCHAFNFIAAQSEEGQDIVEGRILTRLLEKLDQMRAVLADRVFDVIGEVLSLNDVKAQLRIAETQAKDILLGQMASLMRYSSTSSRRMRLGSSPSSFVMSSPPGATWASSAARINS
jgi:SNF2 family DNA or RNA helicase